MIEIPPSVDGQQFKIIDEASPEGVGVGEIVNSPIERWRDAGREIKNYDSDSYGKPGSRSYYEYPSGRRLVIEGEQVMDTCESPWALATVDAAFDSPGLTRLPLDYTVNVLTRGGGLHIAESSIIQRMIGRRRGELYIAELNTQVYKDTLSWAERQMEIFDSWDEPQGIPLDIQIHVRHGDAREVTRALVVDEKKRFNFVMSDTYPLTEDETGINDIEDLNIIKRGLYGGDEGLFTFFPYYPGYNSDVGNIRSEQHQQLNRFFKNVNFGSVGVRPAKNYNYLFENGKPVRELPTVLCHTKK